MATGILAARIGRSLKIAASSGAVSLLVLSAGLWTLSCPNCDRSILYPLVPSWAFFAFLGGLLELGLPHRFRFSLRDGWLGGIRLEDARRIGVALVLTVCLWTLVAYGFWDPRVLYASPISPTLVNLTRDSKLVEVGGALGEICWYASRDSNVKVGSLSKVRQEASEPCPGNVCGVVVPVCLVQCLAVNGNWFPHHSKVDGRRDVLGVERCLGVISQLLPEVASAVGVAVTCCPGRA